MEMGGGGSGLLAMGTQPMAAARAKGNQAATDAILAPLLESPLLWGAILSGPPPPRAIPAEHCSLSHCGPDCSARPFTISLALGLD